MSAKTPTFTVGNVPVYGDAILAPMAGYSDVPYRALCRAYGSAMHYTEFVPVEMVQTRPRPGKTNYYWKKFDSQPGEHPMVFQIFGNNAQLILNAALNIQSLQPDIIDINLGCSTRKVSGRGAGVGMMPQTELIRETYSLLNQHLEVPFSGKLRLGWDDNRNFADVARIMEDNGASLIAMHARTKEQKYGGAANWDEIARLREVVSVPVIGNGDVETPADIDRMKAHTGCDAVMIGRAAIGNPWIFSRIERSDLTVGEVFDAVRIHGRETIAYYGERNGVKGFRKHIKRYLADVITAESDMLALMTTDAPEDLFALFDELESRLGRETPITAERALVSPRI